MQLVQAKALSGIRSWQRDAVVGAALRSFCSWMVPYTDAAVGAFASLALSLAATGCPWIQAEAQRVLQVCCPVARLHPRQLGAYESSYADPSQLKLTPKSGPRAPPWYCQPPLEIPI